MNASFVSLLIALSAHQDAAPLVFSTSIEMPDVEGRIDHLAVDPSRERLFVAALGNDSVEVIDLKAGRHLRSIRGLLEPQGILFLADCDRVVVACGKAGTCEILDAETLEKHASIAVGDDADNLRYDPRAKRVIVAHGGGALGIVDVQKWKHVGDVPLPGHPESFQLDAEGKPVRATMEPESPAVDFSFDYQDLKLERTE